MKKYGIILATVIMIVSLAACGAGRNGGDNTSADVSSNIPSGAQAGVTPGGDGTSSAVNYVLPENGVAEGKIGDIMRTQYFDFAVNTVSAYGEEYADYPADPGNRLLVVNTTVANTSTETLSLFDSEFLLVWGDPDDYDYAYPAGVVGTSGNDFLPGEYSIDPSGEITGDLLFEVPAEMTEFGLSYMEYDVESEEDNTFTVYFQVDAYADGNVSSSGGNIYGNTGENMSTDMFDFKVKSATLYGEYDGNIPFDEYQYLVLEMVLENKDQQEVVMYDSDFIVEWDDSASYEYPESIIVNGKEIMEGFYELPLSGSVDVTMLFQVPEGVNNFVIYFEEYLEDADEPSMYAVNFVPKQG